MFGTVYPTRAALNDAAGDILRHAYRSVCLHLGQISPLAKTCLCNDAVVMAALIDPGLYDERPGHSRSCFERPRHVDRLSHFAACLSLLISKLRLQDNVRDDGRILHRAGLKAMGSTFRKAENELRRMGFPLAEVFAEQERLIHMEASSPDLEAADYAEPVARCYAIAYRFAALLSGHDQELWERVGYLIGGLTYLLDCERDVAVDLQTGAFNPLALPQAKASVASLRRSWTSELDEACTGVQGVILKGCMERVRKVASACHCSRRPTAAPLAARLIRKLIAFPKAIMRTTRPSSSTVLYCTVCVPCGDCGVAVDSDDCGSACGGCCLLICCCICLSKGC